MGADKRPLLAAEGEPPAEPAAQGPPPAHRAANADDVAALQAMAPEALQQTFLGMLPVHSAAAHNALASLDFLINHSGIGIDTADEGGRTPLMHAVVGHAAEATVWLMRHGCQSELEDSRGSRASHWAAQLGSASTLALLGNLGVDLEAPDQSGLTPLAIAVGGNRLEAVEHLVLVVGCSQETRAQARRQLRRGASAFWIARCLDRSIGAHERGPDEAPVCSPTTGGWELPLSSRCCRGPEQVHAEPAHISVLSGVLAILAAVILIGMPPSKLSIEANQNGLSLVCRVLAAASLPCTVGGFVSWCRAAHRAPGHVDASQPSRRQRYAEALGRAAAVTVGDAGRRANNWWGERAPVIHQLAIVGPERSKYSSATRQCVPLFDHYCVFLRNPIGQDNYAAFLSTILWSAASCICLSQAAFLLFYASPDGPILWFAACTTIYFGCFALMWAMLIVYHLYLAYEGLTAWEMLQLSRRGPPAYLLDEESGTYRNPYNHGFFRNLSTRLCPRRSCSDDGHGDDSCQV